MGDVSGWIWVLIPLAAILAGAFKEWAKVQSRQRELGRGTDDLEKAVGALEVKLRDRQASLERRIANLETIVTSQTWDVMHDGKLSNEDKKLLLAYTEAEMRTLREELGDTRTVEILARRLK